MTNMAVKGVEALFDTTVSAKTNVQSGSNTESFDETLNSMRTEKADKSNEFEGISSKEGDNAGKEKLKAVSHKEQVKPEEEITDEQIAAVSEEVISQIKEVLTEKYNISGEQLEATIEGLGLSEESLLNVTELTQVVMKLEGIENQADMLTNSEFAKNLKEIFGQLEDIKANVKPETIQVEQPKEGEANLDVAVDNIGDASKSAEHVIDYDVPQENVEEKATIAENDDVAEETQTTEQMTLKESTEAKENNSDAMLKQDNKKGDVPDVKASTEHTNVQPQDFVQKLTEDLSAKVGETKANDIVRQVVEQTQFQVKQGVTSLEMQLYPEHLGKVLVQVVSHEGSITAQITAESEAAKSALESQLTLLKENLNNQGVKVENVEVTIASHAFEQNMQGEASNEQSFSQSKRSRRNTDMFFDEISDEEVEEIDQSIMELKGSTVSYSA